MPPNQKSLSYVKLIEKHGKKRLYYLELLYFRYGLQFRLRQITEQNQKDIL